VTVCIPGGGSGTAADLEQAKIAFRQAWLPFKAAIGETSLAEALDFAEAARRRGRMPADWRPSCG